MKSAYFEKIPSYGDLYLEQILFLYDNIPIIFTCVTTDHVRFICVCDDIIENQSWIITKIKPDVLLDVLYDRISICKAFELSNENTIVADKINEMVKFESKRYSEIDKCDLPDPDEKLEMQDELYAYIKTIELENLNLQLDLLMEELIKDKKDLFTYSTSTIEYQVDLDYVREINSTFSKKYSFPELKYPMQRFIQDLTSDKACNETGEIEIITETNKCVLSKDNKVNSFNNNLFAA